MAGSPGATRTGETRGRVAATGDSTARRGRKEPPVEPMTRPAWRTGPAWDASPAPEFPSEPPRRPGPSRRRRLLVAVLLILAVPLVAIGAEVYRVLDAIG